MKVPFIINSDLKSLLGIIYTCYKNPEKSSTTKTYTLWLLLIKKA